MILWNKNLGRTRGKLLLEVACVLSRPDSPKSRRGWMLSVAHSHGGWWTLAVVGREVCVVLPGRYPRHQHRRHSTVCNFDVVSGFAQIEHLKASFQFHGVF